MSSQDDIRKALGSAHMVNQQVFEAILARFPEMAADDLQIRYGTFTPAAEVTDVVVPGMSLVLAGAAGLVGAPTLTDMFTETTVGDQAGAPAAGSLRFSAKKPTGAADVTPIASTAPFTDRWWIAIGTP